MGSHTARCKSLTLWAHLISFITIKFSHNTLFYSFFFLKKNYREREEKESVIYIYITISLNFVLSEDQVKKFFFFFTTQLSHSHK